MTSVKKSRMTKATNLSHSQISVKSKYSDLSSKCVSEICTCGMHRCPKVHDLPFNATTTNQQFYKPYKIKREELKQKDFRVPQRHYDPSALQTTYNVEYVKKKPKQESWYHDKQIEYSPNKVPFQGDSQYKSKYLKTNVKPQEQTLSVTYTPTKHKFEGETTYNQQFYRKQLNPYKLSDSISPSRSRYQQKTLPFNGVTSYNDQYKPYKVRIENEQSKRPYTPTRIPFKGSTQYQDVYTRPQNPQYAKTTRDCIMNDLPPVPNKLPYNQDHIKYSARRNAWK